MPRRMFRIVPTPLNPARLARVLCDRRAGAVATFEGRVRHRNDGETVRALHYGAYPELAETEGERVLAEARQKFDILTAACAHRTGRLRPGDIAVWAGVAAGHRGAAFAACRYIIDEIKARLPIWKKEHYASGAAEWINAIGDKPHKTQRSTRRRQRSQLPKKR